MQLRKTQNVSFLYYSMAGLLFFFWKFCFWALSQMRFCWSNWTIMSYFPLDSLGFACKSVMADTLMCIMSPPLPFRYNLNFSQNIHFVWQSATSTSLTEIHHTSCWLQSDLKTCFQRTFSLWSHAELLSVTFSIFGLHKPWCCSIWP